MANFYAFYPPGSASSNASVGANGAPIPGSSTLVAGENPSGDQQPLQTDSNGYLYVDIASSSGLANPLPTKDAADGTPGAAAPTTAIQVAGTDGTDLRVLSTDSSGAINVNNISGTVSLPTGAATSANQTSEIALLTSIAGTQTSGGQQTQIVQGGNTATIDSSGQLNTTVRDTTTTGNITSNQSVTAACQSRSSAGIAITGTWTGTVVLEGSVDGVNFVPVSGAVLTGGLISTSFSANNTIQVNISGLQSIRIRGNTVTSGTASITIECNATAGAVILSESLPQGGNTIGNVGQSGVWTVTVTPVGTASANAPIYNVYSSTNITTSAYTQLVASTSSAINSIHIFDSSGQAMILAVGGSGSEVVQVYVQPGGDTFALNIPAGSRIAYKALTADATTGYLLMSFLG